MRRAIGIALVAVSAAAGVTLLVTGDLVSSQLAPVASGGTPTNRWDVVALTIRPNWLLAVPLGVCFVAGLLLAALPKRR